MWRMFHNEHSALRRAVMITVRTYANDDLQAADRDQSWPEGDNGSGDLGLRSQNPFPVFKKQRRCDAKQLLVYRLEFSNECLCCFRYFEITIFLIQLSRLDEIATIANYFSRISMPFHCKHGYTMDKTVPPVRSFF
ncbi:hypothetical protein Q644_13225 [Brucella intermedia 229E]|uniref:Uncharacterized protein n=1 Tax=Brucella intermedia 229E TaxID=1337887 RepID=U4VJN7_9HYPH|nr:hypothetical protein Q644_13225 [Brucella intermedia 229E]